MDKGFIHKVKQTILEHIEDEKFGVNELASEIGLSSSQLLRRIKNITGKTVTEYLREIRLQEAAKLILKDEYTASEISFQVGFSSPSYFNKCFHNHFGVTPGEYKEKSEKQIIEKENQPKHKKPNRLKHQKNIFLIILSVAVIIISFILIKNSLNTRKKDQTYSIAVLPIKNLSDDNTNQYFADGVMDDIMNHLSTIKEFKIISRTTMEQYRETKKTAPEIAKELKVSYIIESSIQKHKDSVMIIVQLIDAKKDKHIWSKKFEKEFKNIFTLESEIAKEIATKLKTTLTPAKIKQIETNPTENLEAYKLYLKGRFYWHLRTEKDLNNSIYYFNKALELDSSYALAYAGLANNYFVMAWWGWYPKYDGFDKTEKLAIKSLSIDNNISEAHTILGFLTAILEQNWEYGLKETKLAISLNPNSATAHQFHSELLSYLGKKDEARKYMDTALYLNPHNCVMRHVSAGFYYRNSEFKKALETSIIALDLANDPTIIRTINKRIIMCHINIGNNHKAVKMIKTLTLSESESVNDKLIDSLFLESGINRVISWYINWLIENEPKNVSTIAGLFLIIGDTQSALSYLEKSYKNDPIPGYYYLKYNDDFKSIRKEPRFQAILNKLNLAD
ncbi:MAG: helix-turn-helix domain-containing protein [Flavobacteriaceae bacterium]|nr:helix-turn-helix domain-containing protein [Flavobacteriaceae bacterium]